MKLRSLLLLLNSVFILTLYSQDLSVQEFQKKYPQIAFIEKERFVSFQDEELSLLGDKFIVFEREPDTKDIQDYLNNHPEMKKENVLGVGYSQEQQDYVKEWLTTHPNVKIIKRSEYENSSLERQQEYQDKHCLILLGEEVTVTDIELY